MADRTPRFLYDNLAIRQATALLPSSEYGAMPAIWVRDGWPSQRWRTQPGYNVVSTLNDRLDFEENNVARVALLTPGNYPTPALAAAHVKARMDAAVGAANTYTVTYSAVTHKWSVARATGGQVLDLIFGSGGPNFARSFHRDMGFADTTLNGVEAGTTGGNVSYQSRAYLRLDFLSALPFKAAIFHAHNLGLTGTVSLLAKATSDVWTSPTFTQTLTGDALAKMRIAFFAEQTFRYALFLIDSVDNADGFIELGVPFVGGYWEPARGFARGSTRQAERMSAIVRADEGAISMDARNQPGAQTFSLFRQSRDDRNAYRIMEEAIKGNHLFLAKDPLNFPGSETDYGIISALGRETALVGDGNPPERYNINFGFAEDLG